MAELSIVRAFLKDVAYDGASIMKKRKLLFLLGWGQDREGAWRELLNQWVEIGEDRTSLKGIDVANHIVLTVNSQARYGPVTDWAGE